MKRVGKIVLLLKVLISAPAAAQAATPDSLARLLSVIRSRETVRLGIEGRLTSGSVVERGSDSLVVRPTSLDEFVVAKKSVDTIWRFESEAKEGARTGAIAGAIGGSLYLAAATRGLGGKDGHVIAAVPIGAAAGAGVGALVGGFIGVMRGDWRVVYTRK